MSRKKKDKGSDGAVVDQHVRLSTHPVAVAAVKRTRARCGMFGFFIVLGLCLMGGVPAFDATFRALIAGIVCHLAGWYVSIFVWRQIIRNQAAQAAEAYNERIRKARPPEAETETSWAATIAP